MGRSLDKLVDNDSHYRSDAESGQVTGRLLTVSGLTLVLATCSTNSSGPDDGVVIVATTSVLGDIVENVAGDEAQVEVLIPIGVDTHDDVTDELDALLVKVKDDDEARQRFVDLLEVLGPDNPLTASYRKQLTSRLF